MEVDPRPPFPAFHAKPCLGPISLTPDDASLFREGEILLSKGDTEKALWRFKRLITDFPKSPLLNEAKFRMGICYTQLKRPQDAIRILKNFCPPSFLHPEWFRSSLCWETTTLN